MTLPLLQSKTLSDAGFAHGFTTRLGGVSLPPYDALDFAVQRDAARLRENQSRLAQAVGFEGGALHQTTQVHGAALVVANGDPTATLAREADALVAEPGTGHAVAMRVADCVPVLVADPASGRVLAVHAGWRGFEAGVVGVGIRHLAAAPNAGPLAGFVAAIGPSIGRCCFEVGRDVGERIARAAGVDVVARRVSEGPNEKLFVDLRLGVRAHLRAAGIPDDAIEDVPSSDRDACTRCDPVRFYSFRRDGDASGRLLGVIVAR